MAENFNARYSRLTYHFAFIFALFVLGFIALASPVLADELRPGYLEFRQISAPKDQPQKWQIIWKAPLKGGVTPDTLPVLPKSCALDNNGAKANFVSQAVIRQWNVTCNGNIAGQNIGLSEFSASMTDVLVRVSFLDRPVQAMRLTATQPVATISEKPERWHVAKTYFVIGVEHIIFGYDHLLFVLSLVLLLRGGRIIAKTVTAFTLAHSITLVGTTMGFLGLPSRPVEAIIALSIIFLAVEIAKRKQGDPPRLSERIPWIVAFGFGLLHGFGFAGALADIGLPEGEVPMALLMFNVGVEAGQLAIVAIALAVLAVLRRIAPQHMPKILRISAYAIGIIASFWFIERIWG